VLTKSDETIFTLFINRDGFGIEGLSDQYFTEIKNNKISIINKDRDTESISGGVTTNTMKLNNNQYSFYYNFDINERITSLATFDQILSTFKFTE